MVTSFFPFGIDKHESRLRLAGSWVYLLGCYQLSALKGCALMKRGEVGSGDPTEHILWF